MSVREPWLGFIRDVDQALGRSISVHCLGGFVLTACWDLPRATADVDFLKVVPSKATSELLDIAGEGSALANKHKIHFHEVTVADYPENYASRVADISPEGLTRLRLLALDVHDLVLAKIGRNSPRDRWDAKFLAEKGVLDPWVLRTRFETELRPYVLDESRDRLTLDLWLEEFFPEQD
jgi:hypothetical protein